VDTTPPASPPPTPQRNKRGAGIARTLGTGSKLVVARLHLMFSSRGWGFRRLAESHAGSVGGDTLVALALAGTLFFSVPSTEARENVALYLLITLAPFAVIGPFLGRIYERFPAAYRGGLVISSAMRAILSLVMIVQLDTVFLFPLAFAILVFSRFHGISRSSLLPVVLGGPEDLITSNAQIARIGVLAAAVAAPLGALGIWLFDSRAALVFAAGLFAWSAIAATGLPAIDKEALDALATEHADAPQGRRATAPPRPVRLARFATAGVRFLNGFLLLLVAFAFRTDTDANFLDFSALLAAAGIGFFMAALVTPVLDRYISEEPMVVAALAVEAGAAFIAAQVFNLVAAAVLAAAAGFAWGTAKFGFDGLLQSSMPTRARGRAFTNSETFFQFAWVVGALIPIVPVMSVEVGLSLAGLFALVIQVVYVSAVLVPVVAHRRRESGVETTFTQDILDVLE
jgi:hypothetical protein